MRKMFLDELPRKNGIGIHKDFSVINWEESVGYKVKGEYDGLNFSVDIIYYDKKNKRLTLLYNKCEHRIKTDGFIKCSMGEILGLINHEFRLNVGTHIKDDKRDIIITGNERRNGRKYCKYTCNICGWTEGWMLEYSAIKYGCSCCYGRTAVLGINTIWDTDRWMCDLGVSEEDAKGHTRNSNKSINVTCPYCKKDKNCKINNIYNKKTISCTCGDGKSYSEKFICCLLDQLHLNYNTEYYPSWGQNKRYDFYVQASNCVIETHGSQHPGTKYHNNRGFSKCGNKARTPQQELENDLYKEQLAKENGIKNYIVIDCSKSDMEFVKENILNSKLSELYDLSNVDWLECEKFALKNIVKEVCEYWNNRDKEETTVDLGNTLHLTKSFVRECLKKGVKLGWCEYDGVEEMAKNAKRNSKSNKKGINVYKDGVFIKYFNSRVELGRCSIDLFGVFLDHRLFLYYIRNNKPYKGYTLIEVELKKVKEEIEKLEK